MKDILSLGNGSFAMQMHSGRQFTGPDPSMKIGMQSLAIANLLGEKFFFFSFHFFFCLSGRTSARGHLALVVMTHLPKHSSP